MQEYSDVDRRTVIRGVGSLALVGAVAGCSTDGGDGGDGGDDGDGGDGGDGGMSNQEVNDHLAETDNYDGIEDTTGQSGVTVMVGTEANGGNFGFGPPAIRVDAGTTVTWEWTGRGSSHNVVHEEGAFDSGQAAAEEGTTFEHTFEETGTYLYVCEPHESLGMKGAVVVE